jgi:serine/threonine protein kinase
MSASRKCPKCAAEVTSKSLDGLCPKCVAQLALAPRQAAELARTVSIPVPPTETPGDMVGPYKLMEKIGEGGFGVVYVAEQREPVRRRVALKIIKLGMDTRQIVARFEAERQALAMMDHPNIAKVLDAGALESGRPYFVMELVRGVKITDFCDQAKLSTAERLGLFIQICQAIQHAHQKGIIHRDIKPSNVLVTLHDSVPVPKVIDFGIAKATQGQLTDKTIYTQFEQFIGTPAYMSPEQAEMSGLDIDTRSDIYALGVLLYELLTGKTPFDQKELLQSGLDEMRRIIREQEPPRPSTRLGTMEDAQLSTAAARRHVDPPKLIHSVRGDLDWIVMKCLEKERGRRYETANGLAMDIQRHLAQEPVMARPASNLYRLQKLVRRNKVAFSAAAAVAVSLILGLGLSTWLYFREKTARREAESARLSEEQLREKALASEKTVRREAQQLLQAVKLMHFGRTNLDQAETFYRDTLQMQRKLLGNDSVDVAATLSDLARLLQEEGKLPDAEKAQRENLEWVRKQKPLDEVDLAASLGNLGLLLQREDKASEAEPVFRESLALFRRLAATGPSREYSSLGVILHHLAMVLREQKALPEARSLAEEAAAIYQRHPDWPPSERQHSLQVLGDVLKDLGTTDSGGLASFETLYRELLAVNQKLWPNDPDQWKNSLDNLVQVLRSEHKDAEVDQLFDQLLPQSGARKSQRVDILKQRGYLRARNGRWQEAADDLAQVIAADPSDEWDWYVLTPLLIQSGKLADYRDHCKAMLSRFGTTTDAGIAEETAKSSLLVPSAVSPDDLARAANLAQDAVTLGKDTPFLYWGQMTKGMAQYRQGDFTGAIETMRLSQNTSAKRPPGDRYMCEADAYFVSAMARHRLNQPDEARAALARGVEIVQTKLPKLDGGDLGLTWHDVLMSYILMREAKEMIEDMPTAELK